MLEPSLAEKFPMFKAGDILISVRNLNALMVINPTNKKIVWLMEGVTEAQHTATFQPNGRILIFDNKWKGGERSRIIEVDPATKKVTWSYGEKPEETFFSRTIGMVQYLPNDHFLITEGKKSKIFEVTRKGKIVWEFKLPGRASIFSAYRYTDEQLLFMRSSTTE